MKLFNFEYEGKKQLGVLAKDEKTLIPFSAIDPEIESECMVCFIKNCDQAVLDKIKAAAETAADGIPCDAVKLYAPIEYPIHDVLCVGVNYLAHLQEGQKDDPDFKTPEKSVYFGKRANRIIGPGEAIEGIYDVDPALDYEVELAVIIGKECKNITRDEAEDYIFGYSVFNDVSSRQLQMGHLQWYKGKSPDTYTAMGPCIVTKDEIPFPVEVDVICTVNGEERQHSNTRLFLNDIPGVMQDLACGMTLEPGDIIATGTPNGVAMAMDPPGFLKPGDVCVCEVPEIGKLENPVK